MKENRSALFRGRHFNTEIIVTCVRWYLRFSLSLRNVEELMAERGLEVDHTVVWSTMRPGSLMSSSTLRRLKENRKYQPTQVTIISGSKWRPRKRNGLLCFIQLP